MSALLQFLKELQRRSVVKVGTAYLAFAWLIVQLIGEIGPILDWPEWVARAMLGMLAVGFLASIVLAWVYELTNRGIRTTAELDHHPDLKPAFGRTLDLIVIVGLTLALGYFIWESRFSDRSAGREPIESVAVLPFSDLSQDKDQGYFAEGMAEELINTISQIPGLKVAGRTSSFAFHADNVDLKTVAEQLEVTHVLEGSVRASGTDLRISVQLVRADDGFQIWSRSFDRGAEDIFAVQDEIAGLVVASLPIGHAPDQPEDPPRPATRTSKEAYDEYLLARYHLARRTPESVSQAISHFRRATRIDPGYSPAWSGLATVLVVSPYYGTGATAAELVQEIEVSAGKAIELDSGNSEAYSALGTARLIFERDWQQSEHQLEQSVELHPTNPGNVNLYGDYLYTIGNYQLALEYEGRAAELEPLAAFNQHELALVLGLLGRLPEAMELERKSVALSPEFGNAWSTLVRMLIHTGQTDEASQILQAQRDVLGERTALLYEALLLHQAGNADAAHAAAHRHLELTRRGNQSRVPAAWLFARLGDHELAAQLLQEAQAVSDPLLVSPIYFFLPEDMPVRTPIRHVLEQGGLDELYDLRRKFIASGEGRIAQF